MFKTFKSGGLELVTVPEEKVYQLWRRPFQAEVDATNFPGKETFLDASDEEKIMFMRTLEDLFFQARKDYCDTFRAAVRAPKRRLVHGMENSFNMLRSGIFKTIFEVGTESAHQVYNVPDENRELLEHVEGVREDIFFKLLNGEYVKEGDDYRRRQLNSEEKKASQALKEAERVSLFYIGCVLQGLHGTDEAHLNGEFSERLHNAIQMYEEMMELFCG